MQSYDQVHKGREQFWSLVLVAINIAVTAVITLAVMEIGKDTKVAKSLLNCSAGGRIGSLRWWFQNLDRYQYIIGNTETNLVNVNLFLKFRRIFFCCWRYYPLDYIDCLQLESFYFNLGVLIPTTDLGFCPKYGGDN